MDIDVISYEDYSLNERIEDLLDSAIVNAINKAATQGQLGDDGNNFADYGHYDAQKGSFESGSSTTTVIVKSKKKKGKWADAKSFGKSMAPPHTKDQKLTEHSLLWQFLDLIEDTQIRKNKFNLSKRFH